VRSRILKTSALAAVAGANENSNAASVFALRRLSLKCWFTGHDDSAPAMVRSPMTPSSRSDCVLRLAPIAQILHSSAPARADYNVRPRPCDPVAGWQYSAPVHCDA